MNFGMYCRGIVVHEYVLGAFHGLIQVSFRNQGCHGYEYHFSFLFQILSVKLSVNLSSSEDWDASAMFSRHEVIF